MIGVGHWQCTPREKELVNEVLDSGRLSYGPMSKQFENEFAELHGSKFGVLSNSGTSSLQVALQALKEEHNWGYWDEVICPSVTFVATANVILHNKLRPRLVDVDSETYNLNPYLLAQSINPQTKCVIPVHLFGQMADMKHITEIVANENLRRSHDDKIRIIADSCECMFATHHDQPIGAWGDIQCFSTYMAHLITTGVGGIGITNNPVYAGRMRSLVNHGRDGVYISMDDRENKEIMDRRFRFVSVGHSFRITELESALGLAQLETREDMIADRQFNASYLTESLTALGLDKHLQLPTVLAGNTHSYMMYPIVIKGDIDKWDLCNYLEEYDIETREMLPLTNQPVYGINEEDYPAAKRINEKGFYIGCHQGLTREDLDYIVSVLNEYLRYE